MPISQARSGASRYFLYARKSTDREDKQLYSINDQINICRKIATERGIQIIETVEESRSAKLADNRPAFMEMVRRIQAGEAEGILTWHPDRLARNAVDGGRILDLLDRGKLKDLCFGSGYNFENSPEGKFMLSMIFSQAKYYVDKLSHEVTEKFIARRAEGQWLSRAPEGYLNYSDPVTGRKSVIEDPERFPLLRKAFDLLLLGVPPVKVLDTLNNTWGYRCRPFKGYPQRPLTLNRFYELLGNPFYMGQCRFNDTVYPGIHPKMISEDEFNSVQAIFGRATTSRKRKHQFFLCGLIRCGRCGSMVTASKVKGHVYYHCTNARKVCDRTGVREEVLDEQLALILACLAMPEDIELLLKEMIREIAPKMMSDQETDHKRLTEEAKRIQTSIDRLLDIRLENLITSAEYENKKSILQTELTTIKKQLASQGKSVADAINELDETISFSTHVHDRYISGEKDIKRLVIGQVAQAIILSKQNQTDKSLLLEPFPRLAPFFGKISKNGRIKPGISGSGKEKTTSIYSEVAFGVPCTSLIKPSRDRDELYDLATLLVEAQSRESQPGSVVASRVAPSSS